MFVSNCARLRIFYVESDCSVLIKQNKSRNRVVPENIIESLMKKLEVPILNEVTIVEHCVGII
jgi:tRNA uridine 5-carbamoylmethylation protein Kti12